MQLADAMAVAAAVAADAMAAAADAMAAAMAAAAAAAAATAAAAAGARFELPLLDPAADLSWLPLTPFLLPPHPAWNPVPVDRADMAGSARRCGVRAGPKRRHVGRLDRVGHLFGAALPVDMRQRLALCFHCLRV